MVFPWNLKRQIHVPDPRKGGGYHCHLLYRGENTKYITSMKIESGVRFVYLQPHGEGRYGSNEEPRAEKTKKLIGELTVKVLQKIPPYELTIPKSSAELIYQG